MLRQGTLSSEEEKTRPVTTLINVEGSDCKVLPYKQDKSLPHEAANKGQPSKRLYSSAVQSGFIKHEVFQSSSYARAITTSN
jgi:CxxC motif-containing protein